MPSLCDRNCCRHPSDLSNREIGAGKRAETERDLTIGEVCGVEDPGRDESHSDEENEEQQAATHDPPFSPTA